MRKISILTVLATTLLSCGSDRESYLGDGLRKTDAVTMITDNNNNEFISVDLSSLGEVSRIPLSAIVDELNVVKLDSKEEALIGGNQSVKVFDKYILVKSQGQTPVKLFDINGKFLTNIGAYGRGPSEYLNIYDYDLDEKNGIVYILPWQSDLLLRFTVDGEPLTAIPLAQNSPKGVFRVDTESQRVMMYVLPFSNLKMISWVQDFEGNIISQVPSGSHSILPDFSNEVFATDCGDEFSAFTFVFFDKERVDTLYNISPNGSLTPKITVNFGGWQRSVHTLSDLNSYYIGTVSELNKISETTTTTKNELTFLVDKKSLEAGYVSIFDDMLLGEDIEYFSFHIGHNKYVRNFDPLVLIESLDDALLNEELSVEAKERIAKLKSQIKETDNNYIVWGNLKGEL